MTANTSEVFSKIETYYQDYGKRARELKDEGKKIIGYICSFVPVELITASGCVPFRIRGDVKEPITKGDTTLETIVCPFIRSCYDLAVKGRYDFLSGIVIPHGCDSMTRSYSTWSYTLDLPYSHFLNIPSVVKETSFEFFADEIRTYKKSLEEFTDNEITQDDIRNAIKVHNTYREKVRAIYEYRKSDPPMITGTDLMKTITVGTSLPVEEAIILFDDVLNELSQLKESPVKKGPRIMIDSACLDNIELVNIIEESGANVVTDTICNGTRDSFPLVDEDSDPIDALSNRYLNKINCPKTYREKTSKTFEDDIKSRFGDAGQFAKDYNVDGIILFVYRYCDPFGFEVPARKTYYDSINVPMLYLEDQYSTGTIGQLKTRIQAFIEMIG